MVCCRSLRPASTQSRRGRTSWPWCSASRMSYRMVNPRLVDGVLSKSATCFNTIPSRKNFMAVVQCFKNVVPNGKPETRRWCVVEVCDLLQHNPVAEELHGRGAVLQECRTEWSTRD